MLLGRAACLLLRSRRLQSPVFCNDLGLQQSSRLENRLLGSTSMDIERVFKTSKPARFAGAFLKARVYLFLLLHSALGSIPLCPPHSTTTVDDPHSRPWDSRFKSKSRHLDFSILCLGSYAIAGVGPRNKARLPPSGGSTVTAPIGTDSPLPRHPTAPPASAPCSARSLIPSLGSSSKPIHIRC